MNLETQRTNEPESLRGSFSFEAPDFKGAFEDVIDPDEQLYFDLSSAAGKKKKVSERFLIYSKMAALVEAAEERATALNSMVEHRPIEGGP